MAHAAHDHDTHDAGEAHLPLVEGDDLPAHGPRIEEPRSPAWLPYLGAAFFGLALIWWLATPTEEQEAATAAAAAASASASASAAPSGAEPAH